ncbi:MAG: OmpA family protein [Bacteroidetes bacterium]|jgi:OOP family OmpA-OmpF porin|nr:OmpA family protein [Bacteroidota bacterium]
MKRLVRLIFLLCPFFLVAQSSSDAALQNIVPNSSFEAYSGPPIGWFYRGDHYSQVMKYWSAATIASPDVFGPRVRVPSHWAKKGFGEQSPRTGHSMSGITVYGCVEGKPHCREYIQIQLSEPLVTGQRYYVEMWVNHLPRSLRSNNLGFYFSEKKVSELTDQVLDFEPQFYSEKIIDCTETNWQRVAGRFIAEAEAEFLLIGNFFPDTLTKTQVNRKDSLKFAYYYIEDVLVKKVPPILPIPVKEDDLTKLNLEEGMIVTLQNIHFEFDHWELHPRSFIELKKLLKIMRDNPSLVIELRGHTDDKGSNDYNFDLSEKRASSVVQYLKENGIGEHRTRYRGFGSNQPIAPNDTKEGRRENRRVEFLVIQKLQ